MNKTKCYGAIRLEYLCCLEYSVEIGRRVTIAFPNGPSMCLREIQAPGRIPSKSFQ